MLQLGISIATYKFAWEAYRLEMSNISWFKMIAVQAFHLSTKCSNENNYILLGQLLLYCPVTARASGLARARSRAQRVISARPCPHQQSCVPQSPHEGNRAIPTGPWWWGRTKAGQEAQPTDAGQQGHSPAMAPREWPRPSAWAKKQPQAGGGSPHRAPSPTTLPGLTPGYSCVPSELPSSTGSQTLLGVRDGEGVVLRTMRYMAEL